MLLIDLLHALYYLLLGARVRVRFCLEYNYVYIGVYTHYPLMCRV